MRCTSPRRSSPASCTRCSRRPRRSTSAPAARWSPGPPAPRRSAPGTPAGRSRSAGRPAVAPATSRANRFDALRADTDVFTTFEGDNHILLQLVAKGLLTDYSSRLRRPRPARHGPLRRRAGGRHRGRADRVHKLLERLKRRRTRRRRLGRRRPSSLDPEYQLAMFRWREEHMLAASPGGSRRGMDSELEPGRGVQPLPGPRHRRGPGARRAAGAGGVRRQGPGHRRTARTRPRSTCSATSTRCRRSRRDRGLVDGARPAVARRGPRRSAGRSTSCAARSGRSPRTWSTRSAYRRRCRRPRCSPRKR